MSINIERLIRENHNAPVDTLIRTLFDMGCVNFIDNDDDTVLNSIEEILHLWYDVDSLDLKFTLPYSGNRAYIRLVHQRDMVHPHIEDISDYSTNLEQYPQIMNTLNEDRYPLIYTE